ncbi:MAG TPA: hypothetical protein VHW65_07255, partial [Gemmatimonadales bacterium]|nr:hypothetical protein [Gemmatimonadales bacterium]
AARARGAHAEHQLQRPLLHRDLLRMRQACKISQPMQRFLLGSQELGIQGSAQRGGQILRSREAAAVKQ